MLMVYPDEFQNVLLGFLCLRARSIAHQTNMADVSQGAEISTSQDTEKPTFQEPVRKILKPADLAKWERSQGKGEPFFLNVVFENNLTDYIPIGEYQEISKWCYRLHVGNLVSNAIHQKLLCYNDLLGFITLLGNAVKGKKITTPRQISEVCQKVIDMLDCMDKWIDEIPPTEQPQRFGNKAFRDWYDRMFENAQSMSERLLPETFKGASIELIAYLKDSFGNKTRIDYGTGHEASFVLFLCCLYKLRVFQESDQETIVFEIFNKYLQLMHRLQSIYRMEPAGSHGVWGLDDFQFLPFIWGAAQLIDHQHIFPKSFLLEDIIQSFYKDYMFLDCIKFINTMKTGPFAEHSNTLWGISGVSNWNKVYSGLMKMYKKEVLSKFPIVQHFLFGTLMSIDSTDLFKKPS